MRIVVVMWVLVLGLAGCVGKPSGDDPLLSDNVLKIEEFFVGHVVAHGQF